MSARIPLVSDNPEAEQDPFTYGPFHRLESPTQSRQDALQQVASQEIWGRARRQSDIPQVQAYLGPLPAGAKGIEFRTAASPDQGTVHARWTGPREGVRVEDGFCKIACRITKNTQRRTFRIGITGPSGCGKSTLAKKLGYPVVGEDPSTFLNPEFVPYETRDPATERASHVRWPLVQKQITRVKDDVMIVEHFLLAFLPNASAQLDVLIILDSLQADGEQELQSRGRAFRDRRVTRQMNRSSSEQTALRDYYDKAVWPIYCNETRPALKQLMTQLEDNVVLKLDPIQLDPSEILFAAKQFLDERINYAGS